MSWEGLMLFSDMDGTLLTGEGEIPAPNLRALADFLAQGGRFALATGRHYPSTARHARALGVNAPCILSNGAVIYDYEKNKLLSVRFLATAAAEYLRVILKRFPHIRATAVFLEDRFDVGLGRKPAAPSRNGYRPLDRVSDPMLKVLFHVPREECAQILAWLQMQRFAGVYFTASSDHYIELLGEGCSKGSALLEICGLLGLPRERVAAIGDYYNDREMLAFAGLSACPAEAPEEIRRLCGYLTVPAARGAVADFLAHLKGEEL